MEVQSGSTVKYARLAYERNGLKLQTFVNALDGEGTFLLQRGSDGRLLFARFENQVYDVEVSNGRVLGNTSPPVVWRQLPPQSLWPLNGAAKLHTATKAGRTCRTSVFLSDRLRWIVGGRIDRFGVLDKMVFSPRTALLVKPQPNHAIRFSFNRAFRAPSLFNSFIDVAFLQQAPLPGVGALRVPVSGRRESPVEGRGADGL